MDRLSSYAAREAESVDQETRKQCEDEAITRLLQKLEISEEAKREGPAENAESAAAQENGLTAPANEAEGSKSPEEERATSETGKTRTGIPENIKLYDIFYDQVTNLIKSRALPIQDTMALLVSLVNLALYGYPTFPDLNSVDGVG